MAQTASEEDFDPTKFSMRYNYSLLTSHVLQKGFQAGSLIGAALVAPIMCFRAKQVALPIITKAVAYSAATGTVLSGAMLAAKVPSIDEEGLEDRVYRLHYNQGQTRVDRFCQMGGIAGGAVTVAFVAATPISVVGGAGLGTALGIGAHVLTAPKKEKSGNIMIEELKR